ncbi:hypothetical protein EV641_114148 [Rhodococcus sp. SMB37]|uniref:hypothetical protein n=1 Tax=Rhodococcus sp. SMB37 TaxID=2512213 RepID=UPI0010E06017|nr:hypothetical protein [Rhodococcus sp. SMB37]TCN49865.1 hypothetical protein EV641_114148 [Rhodococcus sp. SMB37]
MVIRSDSPKRHVLRTAYGSSYAEAFLVIAIITILVTRLYLALTGYPQVGGATLHIAHALYGGAAMMAALLIGWLFLGFGPRVLAVVVGGIGFGLFLDEIGKFVTKDNDYFYGPSAEIMYVLIVLVLVANRLIRIARPPTAAEYLANAAAIAADGLAGGIPPHRREAAARMLDEAQKLGSAPRAVDGIRMILDSAGHRDDRIESGKRFAVGLIPGFFRSPRWVPILGWLMVLAAAAGVVFGVVQLVSGGVHVDTDDVRIEIDRMGITGGILFVSASITLLMALPAMIAVHRGDSLRALRTVRTAALIFTALNALANFATSGFGALPNLALGLFTMAVLSHHISVRTEQPARAADPHHSAIGRVVGHRLDTGHSHRKNDNVQDDEQNHEDRPDDQ